MSFYCVDNIIYFPFFNSWISSSSDGIFKDIKLLKFKVKCFINVFSGGRLESRTLKALLTLDGFQDRFHRQLDWPSVIHTNLSKFYVNELSSNYSIVCCQLSIIAQSAISVNCFIVHCHVSISNILRLSYSSPCSA